MSDYYSETARSALLILGVAAAIAAGILVWQHYSGSGSGSGDRK